MTRWNFFETHRPMRLVQAVPWRKTPPQDAVTEINPYEWLAHLKGGACTITASGSTWEEAMRQVMRGWAEAFDNVDATPEEAAFLFDRIEAVTSS